MKVIDLSIPPAEAPIYRDARGYADPPLILEDWIGIGERRGGFVSPFRVSRLTLGLHSGTHIDAPSHFHPGGRTLADLQPDYLLGWVVVVDARDQAGDVTALADHALTATLRCEGAIPLVLVAEEARLGPAALAELIGWGRPVVAIVGSIDGYDPDCPTTSALLAAGLYLVVDLAETASEAKTGDLLVIAPLSLGAVEAAPARVFAIRGSGSAGLTKLSPGH